MPKPIDNTLRKELLAKEILARQIILVAVAGEQQSIRKMAAMLCDEWSAVAILNTGRVFIQDGLDLPHFPDTPEEFTVVSAAQSLGAILTETFPFAVRDMFKNTAARYAITPPELINIISPPGPGRRNNSLFAWIALVEIGVMAAELVLDLMAAENIIEDAPSDPYKDKSLRRFLQH